MLYISTDKPIDSLQVFSYRKSKHGFLRFTTLHQARQRMLLFFCITIARMDTEVQDVPMAVEGVEMSDVDYSSIMKESTESENITLPDPFESFLRTQGADCCELPPKKRKRSKLVCFHPICAGTYLGLVVNKKEKELLQHT